jgi:hypothetical protein
MGNIAEPGSDSPCDSHARERLPVRVVDLNHQRTAGLKRRSIHHLAIARSCNHGLRVERSG